MPTAEFMSLNGRIVPYRDCTIHAFSALAKYGSGVFEGLRGYWNADAQELFVFRLREHLERLRFGMKVMRFDETKSLAELEWAVLEMLRANRVRENVHIRLIAFVEEDGELIASGPVGLVCGALARPSSPRVERGVQVRVSSWARIGDHVIPPRVKCVGAYVNNRAAEIDAARDGYDGVLMLNQQGKLAEGSGACVFILRDGRLHTPDVTSGILESITRATVIELARDELGIEVVERPVERSELWACEEAFWCGTGYEIQPIVGVDRIPVGEGLPGPLTRRLQELYFDHVYGRTNARATWRKAVYAGARAAAA
jgi:branched-chain amino acid aminotransferase